MANNLLNISQLSGLLAGILKGELVGPFELPGRLNDKPY